MTARTANSVLGRRPLTIAVRITPGRFVDGVGLDHVIGVSASNYSSLCWAGSIASALLSLDETLPRGSNPVEDVARKVLLSACGEKEGWSEAHDSIDVGIIDFVCALEEIGFQVGLNGSSLGSAAEFNAPLKNGVVFSRLVKSVGHIVLVYYCCTDTEAYDPARARVISVYDSKGSWTEANRAASEFMLEVYSGSL